LSQDTANGSGAPQDDTDHLVTSAVTPRVRSSVDVAHAGPLPWVLLASRAEEGYYSSPTSLTEEDPMGMMKEFKEFAMRGNVMDMAIGIVIGAAFGAIVTSFVADVVTPPLGLIIGGIDFSAMNVVLKEAVGETPAVTINYGIFLQKVFDFIVIAFVIFLVIKAINNMKRKEEEAPAAPAAPPAEEVLLTEIRDLLKTKN
jgi:large conductance mechanosensitive channel